MDMKKPPMAQTLETDDFCKYLLALKGKKNEMIINDVGVDVEKVCINHTHLPPAMAGDEPTSLTAKRN